MARTSKLAFTGLLSLFFRGLTIASKLILVLYIGRYMSADKMGTYSLFSSALFFSINLAGLEYWNINSRNILSGDGLHKATLLRNQLLFHCITYIFLFPLFYLPFYLNILDMHYIWFFFVLLITEHFGIETYRLLIIEQRSIVANALLFLRSGLWVYLITIWGMFNSGVRSLEYLWWCWSISGICVGFISLFWFSYLPWRKVWNLKIDWLLIRQTAFEAAPYLAMILSAKAMEFADRFILKAFMNDSAVGIYTFYATLAMVIQTLTFTAVVGVQYPAVVQSYLVKNYLLHKELFRRMSKGVVLSCVAAMPLSFVAVQGSLLFVGKGDSYSSNINLYWILVISAIIMSLSLLPHYALYSRKLDKAILISSLIGLATTLISEILLVYWLGLPGAAIGNLLGAISVFISKWVILMRASHNETVPLTDSVSL